jgi:hypothetical protein
MGFRNIVLPNGESANPIEAEAINQIPERGYFSTIEFGAGSKTFKGDERGIWMGSSDFETAPFSVDMSGNIKIRASALTQDISFSIYDENGNLSVYLGL